MPVDPSRHSLAILDDWEGAAELYADWTPLASLPRTIFREPIPRADLAKTLEPFTILHAMRERTKIDRAILDSLPNLRFIATTGHRNRGIDVAAARERGIVVSGTLRGGTEGSSGAVEQTWALLLALARRIPQEHASMRDGAWISGVATGLADKTLGLVGVGRLGKQVAAIAKAFGMRVVAWSPHLTQARADEAGVELAHSLDDLLSTSDFISLHLVHASSTTGIIGRRELELLKPTAFLVNTSRGPLVDEQALVDALRAKRFAGAGLDVFDQEPLPRDHPLRTLDNVVLSPHMGYVEDSAFEAWWPQSIENIDAFLRGSPVRVLES
ncbi:D-2-hydroxyacid dehydrogenase family protein [Rhodotorula paludigena]|uniref:D-2-hydroxyacid dehydrogenase family protein n=1 Tax=Rhodotorula paludigena TaxID=86838 RepID=UPI00317B2BF3